MSTRIERVVTRAHLHDPNTDVEYWLTRPVEERIAAVTELRRLFFHLDDEPRARLQRVHRVLDRA